LESHTQFVIILKSIKAFVHFLIILLFLRKD